jgi:alkylation response protein AidB-like acyl-CoA dehydrogenase
MRFSFDEDQLLFQKTLRDFLAKECPPALVRSLWETETGRSPELWRKLAELGVPGALVPEVHGGPGLDEIGLVLLLEETGRAACAEPVIATAAVGAPLLVGLGGALAERWLPRVAAGEAHLAVGHPVNPFVADAHVADLLLLARGDELHAVAPDAVALVRQPSNDPSRRIFAVEWEPRPETCAAAGAKARTLLDAALDRGALACAAQLLGVAEALLERAAGYARERRQFGKPIGSFQAVKHLLANVKVELEYARPVVHRAAHSVARAAASRARDVSHAKLVAGEAAGHAARIALQVHGAIGYTWEQDLHLWMRRAWSLDLAFGGAPFHRARVAEAVLAPGARLGPGTSFEGA